LNITTETANDGLAEQNASQGRKRWRIERIDELDQWFPKWAVPPPCGRWETLGGWWSRNGRLGGRRRPS